MLVPAFALRRQPEPGRTGGCRCLHGPCYAADELGKLLVWGVSGAFWGILQICGPLKTRIVKRLPQVTRRRSGRGEWS